MYNIIIGFLFLIIFTIYLYTLGCAALNDNKYNYSLRLVVGYLIYSFFIAIGGIVVQLFNLSYNCFLIYFIFLIFSLLTYKIIKIKKNKIKLFENGIKQFIKENFIIIIILVLIMATSVAYIEFYWMANCLDDGYYLVRSATLSKIDNAFRIVPSTGFIKTQIDSYVVSTWELEASVYIKILNIDPSSFLRIFMSIFNHFLYINVIIAFVKELILKLNLKVKSNFIQFIPVIVLFFSTQYTFLSDYKLLDIQDSWMFNTAMYYGSSIVRTMGILLILLQFIRTDKINFKTLLWAFIISVVLMSKSAIALPVIFVTYFCCFIVYVLFRKGKISKFISLVIIFAVLIGSVILKNIYEIDSTVMKSFVTNIKFIPVILSVIIILLSFFSKKKEIIKINLIMIFIGIFLLIDPLNDITENLSIYNFVANRFFTCYVYTIFVLAFSYLFIFVYLKLKKKAFAYLMLLMVGIGFFRLNLYSYDKKYGNIFNAYDIVLKNTSLIPNSIKFLGGNIEEISKKSGKTINVMAQEGIKLDGYDAAFSIILRAYAPNTRIITATGRYGSASYGVFKNYIQEDTNTFHNFIFVPSDENYKKFKNLLNKYPIDCIVTTSDVSEKLLQQLGFKRYSAFNDDYNCYYIYYNTSSVSFN